MENKSTSNEGISNTGNLADFFEIGKDQISRIKTEGVDTANPSAAKCIPSHTNSLPVATSARIPDLAVFVKVENEFFSHVGCNSTKFFKTKEDWTRGIKVERVNTMPVVVPFSPESVGSCTKSDFVAESIIIKKEEDLDVKEKEFDTLVGGNVVSFDGKKEGLECGVESSQLAKSCDQTTEGSDAPIESNFVPFCGKEEFTNESGKEDDKACESSAWGLCEEDCGESSLAGVAYELPSEPQNSKTCYDNSCSIKSVVSEHLESGLITSTTEKNVTEENPFSCPHCSAKFKKQNILKVHLVTHHNEQPHACPLCSAKFPRKKDLKNHLALQHPNEKTFLCTYCPSRFRTKSNLNVHLISHSGERRFACEYCPVKCKRKDHLLKHLRIHSEERPFACTSCSATFKGKEQLKEHLNTHANDDQFSCEYCPAKFCRKVNLMMHLTTHSETKLSTSTAPKPQRKDRPNDQPNTYTNECKYCHAKFKRKNNLRDHLKVHSINKPVIVTYRPSERVRIDRLNVRLETPTDERLLSCEYCPAKFQGQNRLIMHMTTHTGRKQLLCTHCSAVFTRKAHLQRHRCLRFSCEYCSVKFHREADLTVHLRSHSEDKSVL